MLLTDRPARGAARGGEANSVAIGPVGTLALETTDKPQRAINDKDIDGEAPLAPLRHGAQGDDVLVYLDRFATKSEAIQALSTNSGGHL